MTSRTSPRAFRDWMWHRRLACDPTAETAVPHQKAAGAARLLAHSTVKCPSIRYTCLGAIAWLLLGVGSFIPGCARGSGGNWLQRLRPTTSEAWLDMALESEQPDRRRRGVVGLSDSSEGSSDWAMRVFDTIARTDADAMVRCAALRAMSKSPTADRVPTALKLLRSETARYDDVRPAPGPVRWSAARLLLAVARACAFRADQEPEIIETSLARLKADRDRNVRLTLLAALAYFPDRQAATALIDAMERDGFAVRHAAEMSLVALTGVTHDHDPDAWRKWFRETESPFEGAGEVPESLRQTPKKRRWDWLGWGN